MFNALIRFFFVLGGPCRLPKRDLSQDLAGAWPKELKITVWQNSRQIYKRYHVILFTWIGSHSIQNPQSREGVSSVLRLLRESRMQTIALDSDPAYSASFRTSDHSSANDGTWKTLQPRSTNESHPSSLGIISSIRSFFRWKWVMIWLDWDILLCYPHSSFTL